MEENKDKIQSQYSSAQLKKMTEEQIKELGLPMYSIIFDDGAKMIRSKLHRSYDIEFIRLVYSEFAAAGYSYYRLFENEKLIRQGLMIEEESEF